MFGVTACMHWDPLSPVWVLTTPGVLHPPAPAWHLGMPTPLRSLP